MPEAEEVLIDVARHATAAAQGLWQRLREERRESPRHVFLADCKPRLVLLIEAVLGLHLAVRVAQPPAPVSWLARRLRRHPWAPAYALPLPANDGQVIYLPPAIELEPEACETQEYPLLALLQALRCARGSAAWLAYCDSALATDLFLLAEAAAADRALRQLLPGWRAALEALYARSAAALAAQRPRTTAQAEVLALYRSLLDSQVATVVPLARTPQDALDWSRDYARRLATRHPGERYCAWLADKVVGRLLAVDCSPTAVRHAVEPPAAVPPPHQRAAMARRPRVRAAETDEDDETPGRWMIQTSEPQEHAEDPLGLNRPQDREADIDAQGAADSLSELESARLVSTPEQACETLHSADPVPRLLHDGTDKASRIAIEYPEWDWRAGAYHSRAVKLHQVRAPEGSSSWAEVTLARHQGTLREVRRRFGALRPHRQTLKRLGDGEDIDCDALIDERSERRAGLTPAGDLYQSRRPTSRRIGLLLLIDASGSTEAWVADRQRVIDVEKEAALVAACALDAARIEFAMLAFSGEGARGVHIGLIKDFAERCDGATMRRVAAIEPDRYTRLGAPLRHASALLARQAVDLRLLLLLSDGKPNDCDRYASRYGLEDARQALIEARMQHIDPYCFTVDREASGYLPYLFGAGHYTIVQHAQQLPLAFIDWLRAAARRSIR